MSDRVQWLRNIDRTGAGTGVDGIVPVSNYSKTDLRPEQVVVMEKAAEYRAAAVFFEAEREGKPPVAQAFIFVLDGPVVEQEFAELHKRLWSWGGVPLVYLRTPGLVRLFRCAHKPDFETNGKIIFNPRWTLDLAGNIANDPWWDSERLQNGTLWDDTETCNKLLSSSEAAQNSLINAVKDLHRKLNNTSGLPKNLQRRLLVLSILIAYLQERGVFETGFFERFKSGSINFFQILANGHALIRLLEYLEEWFNGDVFKLTPIEREIIQASELADFATMVAGYQDSEGQLSLWQRYSFSDIPVELISHIYQDFVSDKSVAIYTAPFLVRLMIGEVLDWKRLKRIENENEVILDPACGSGIFLVEAYKRLVLYWRSQNEWQRPGRRVLKKLLTRVHGIDVEDGAVELATFSLCLAMCEALKPEKIRTSQKLFPVLRKNSIHRISFFDARKLYVGKEKIGVILGNPPFASSVEKYGAQDAYERYNKGGNGKLPDKQLAYLFLNDSMEMLEPGGILSMIQPHGFLYNHEPQKFRKEFIVKWDVRQILDFISVRGVFKKGKADVKIVVIMSEAAKPSKRQILHATFRRSGRADAQQGFDIDYYDMHWLPSELVLENDDIWRNDLLGGGRIIGFVERMKKMKTLDEYAEKMKQKYGWERGEGFIAGESGKLKPAPYITGKPKIEPRHLTVDASLSSLKIVSKTKFASPRSREQFESPMVLVHEQQDLASRYFATGYYTYGHKIVGFANGEKNPKAMKKLGEWFESNRRVLSALVCAGGTTMFTQRASSVGQMDILALPSPEEPLDISFTEQILVDDILDYYRDLIRLGEGSVALSNRASSQVLTAFNQTYVKQINAIYKKKKLRPLTEQSWAGFICQPYVFGEGEVDWDGADSLKDKLNKLLKEQRDSGLNITRIVRIYDGPFIFLLKPDRLRYWLRSIALRDSDETLSDLWDQGF